jgi:subtilisin family serine protease
VNAPWHRAFTPEALRYAEPHRIFASITPEEAWGGATGRGVRVAVIDSGIEADHPAVGGMVRGGVTVVEEGEEITFDEAPHGDAYGHGTACAGIIHGLAPEAELYSVRVLGPNLRGTGTAFVAGLRWAVEHGMHVLNLSLGSTRRDFFDPLHELADAGYFRNAVLVTAANNLARPSYPSTYASVVSVARHEEKDPFLFFYNPAPPVEFGAPGVDVDVAWLNGSYIKSTGNSFAAPHITGIVARILSKHPGLAPFHVKTILHATAWNVRHPPPEGPPVAATQHLVPGA